MALQPSEHRLHPRNDVRFTEASAKSVSLIVASPDQSHRETAFEAVFLFADDAG